MRQTIFGNPLLSWGVRIAANTTLLRRSVRAAATLLSHMAYHKGLRALRAASPYLWAVTAYLGGQLSLPHHQGQRCAHPKKHTLKKRRLVAPPSGQWLGVASPACTTGRTRWLQLPVSPTRVGKDILIPHNSLVHGHCTHGHPCYPSSARRNPRAQGQHPRLRKPISSAAKTTTFAPPIAPPSAGGDSPPPQLKGPHESLGVHQK